ncbi:MAG: methyltransferase domain-containing protein [Cyanobacteria bacterium]|nr:methyltransferase domain-containing protein [Cyanobacteriota bacterium]
MDCRICHKAISKTTTLKNGRRYFHCEHCLFIGMDQEFFLDAQTEKARYDLHHNSIDDQGYVKMLETFIKEAISPYQVQRILDYGSGPNPVLAELLGRQSYQVEIYDPCYAINNFSEASFDLLCATEVVEHFYDPMQEFPKMLKLLKPLGYLSLMTRFSPSYDEFKSWFYKDDSTHTSFYSLKTFEYIALELGLQIVNYREPDLIVLQKRL